MYNEVIEYLKTFGPILGIATFLSIWLAWPANSIIAICVQIAILNFYVYVIHRIMHLIPSHPLNYHIFSHHDKKFNLSRPLELICETLCNLSWFAIILVVQWICNVQVFDPILVCYIGIVYTSVHVINLSCFDSVEHKTHHIDWNYNYGPAYFDALYGTLKVDESFNQNWDIINTVVVALGIKYAQSRYGF